jgi:PAS domain-containing protein
MSDVHQRLQLALETAWDATVINGDVLDGTVSWSWEGAVLLGLEARAIGQPFRIFLTFVHQQDRASLVTRMQERVSGCARYDLEYCIVRADGTLRWIARVHVYREADAVITRRQDEIGSVARLAEALELQHFRLFAQPIVALRGGAACLSD